MARCSGCSGDRCSCVLRAGENVTVSGAGTATNPFVITAQGGEGTSVPTGTIVMYGGTAIPAGWLTANGAAVNRTAYAALFAAIGTTYGAGDGSTTFALPNLVSRFPVGAGAFAALGTSGGLTSTTLTVSHIPQHVHTIPNHTHTMDHDHPIVATGTMNQNAVHTHAFTGDIYPYSGGAAQGLHFGSGASHPGYGEFIYQTNTDHTHYVDLPNYTGSTGSAGAGNTGAYGTASPTAVPTVPPYTSVNFIIKT